MKLTNATFQQVVDMSVMSRTSLLGRSGVQILEREELAGRLYVRLLYHPRKSSGRNEVFMHQSWTESAYAESLTVVTYGNGRVVTRVFDDVAEGIAYMTS